MEKVLRPLPFADELARCAWLALGAGDERLAALLARLAEDWRRRDHAAASSR